MALSFSSTAALVTHASGIRAGTQNPQPFKTNNQQQQLPLKKIPGDYGLPLIGPIRDRHDYLYTQGADEYFKSRIQRHQSTVLRLNMPPGPPISSNSNVIALLDGVSFPLLFDTNKVEKKDLFTGTYMPSLALTGGYRVLSYLDPSEPKHGLLKKFLFQILSSRRHVVIEEFRHSFGSMFGDIEKELEKTGKADFGEFNDQAAFGFLSKSLFGTDPESTALGKEGPGLILKWVLFQLGPLISIGLPSFIDDLVLRTIRLPSFLVKSDYQRLYDFFYTAASAALSESEKIGISKEEACHNLLFATCFNSFGGMKIFFPSLVKWISRCGARLHSKLSNEIRTAVKLHDGKVTMRAMEEMPLLKSLVYEAFRMEPPVPMQYGKAKKDIIVESHDNVFKVKKGEMLFGYQPFATKDGRIFDRPEEFIAERFIGVEGERLLKHVIWSNGPESESPRLDNKQCAGKDFVILVSRLLIVELFLRYDSFDIQLETFALGTSVTITSLKKAAAPSLQT